MLIRTYICNNHIVDSTIESIAMTSVVVAAIYKSSSSSNTGISFYDEGGKVFIHEVQSDGLFGSTNLQAGMQVIAMNNISTQGMSSANVSKIIDEAKGTVTILSQDLIQVDIQVDVEEPDIDLGQPYIIAAPTSTAIMAMSASSTDDDRVVVPKIVKEAQDVSCDLSEGISSGGNDHEDSVKEKDAYCNMKRTLICCTIVIALVISGAVLAATYVFTDGFNLNKDEEKMVEFGHQDDHDTAILCANNHELCSSWAAEGKCETNHNYMLDNCQKSCNVCNNYGDTTDDTATPLKPTSTPILSPTRIPISPTNSPTSPSRRTSSPTSSPTVGAPTFPLLVDYGPDGHIGRTLQNCEGDCDYDSHCAEGLICYHRNSGDTGDIPGCIGIPLSFHDYCVQP